MGLGLHSEDCPSFNSQEQQQQQQIRQHNHYQRRRFPQQKQQQQQPQYGELKPLYRHSMAMQITTVMATATVPVAGEQMEQVVTRAMMVLVSLIIRLWMV